MQGQNAWRARSVEAGDSPQPDAPAPTRRRVMATGATALVTASLGACTGPDVLPSGGGGGTGTKPLSGTVELWSNAGYAYKDRTGSRLVEEFQQLHPGVRITWTDTAVADFMSKLVTTTVAGNPPDISYADRYATKSFACKGAASALDNYIKQSKTFKLDNLWPIMRTDVTYKGKVYAMAHQGGGGILWYHKNMFREVGLDPERPPTTWDQAEQAIARLTRRSGTSLTRAGWVPQRGYGRAWMMVYWQLGGELLDAEEKKAIFNNEKAVQAFEWLLKVNDQQGGDEAIAQLYSGANNYDAFAQGKVAMVFGTNATPKGAWANVQGLELGSTFWPTPPGGKRSNYVGGWSLLIPNGAKNPDAAFAYLDYKLGDDAQVRWALDWDSVPSTRSAAMNDRYYKTSPERKVSVDDMPFGKWVISAPGGDKALAYQTAVQDNVFQRKMSAREALDTAVRDVQRELDEGARACAI